MRWFKNKILKSSMKISLALLLVISSLFVSVDFASAKDDAAGGRQYVNGHPCKSDEVIVRFNAKQTPSGVGFALNAVGSGVEKNVGKGLTIAKVPNGKTLVGFIDELRNMPEVEYAQPNYIYDLDTTVVNDLFVTEGAQWHLKKIEAYDAWDVTMGSSDIKVAVLDSGIDLDHEDLIGQVVAQADVVDNDGIAQDDNGHGTHVCGIIAAVADNGLGGAGVAPGVKLIVVDIFQETAGGWEATTTDNIEAIDFAIEQGADVINMSFGGNGDDELFEEAINGAVAAGAVCISAAGNNNNADAYYPSDYEACISVISTTSEDTRSSFSNYGSAKDISAPGSSIKATYFDGGYKTYSGTSMAAPVISGVAALMLSVNPSLTIEQIKQMLYGTAVDLGTEGKDDYFANGRVDASAAVAEAAGGSSVLDIRFSSEDETITTTTGTTLTYETFPSTADETIIWSSSNDAVATVIDGVVTGHTYGIADITASNAAGTVFDTCEVLVSTGVQSIVLNKHEADINLGETVDIAALVYPISASDPSVTWVSSDPGIASVEATSILTCTVTGTGAGTAVITATTKDGGFTDICTVNVTSADIESSVYTIDRAVSSISGVYEKTSVDGFKANLINEPGEIFVYTADDILYTGGAVATGMTVRRTVGGVTTDELTIIVKGDCSGDGVISIADYTLIRLDILELKPLLDEFILAADVNNDQDISIADYTLVRLHILELKAIT